MKLNLRIDDRPYPLELERDGEEWIANSRRASVIEVEPGIYSVLIDGRSFEARMEGGQPACVVNIGPRRFAVEVTDPRQFVCKRDGAPREGREALTAPMPGRVVRVLAQAGDRVEAGQGILVIEAMKMQNELKAPKAGTLVSLTAQEGATVAGGEALGAIE
jgi:biotin carboxyl carrier protein